MQPDPDTIVTFLTRLYDMDHNLERELAWSDPGQDAIIHAERFAADDPVGFADRAVEINAAGCNTYFTPALLESAGGSSRARDSDVAACPVLWCDLDTPDAIARVLPLPEIAITSNTSIMPVTVPSSPSIGHSAIRVRAIPTDSPSFAFTSEISSLRS